MIAFSWFGKAPASTPSGVVSFSWAPTGRVAVGAAVAIALSSGAATLSIRANGAATVVQSGSGAAHVGAVPTPAVHASGASTAGTSGTSRATSTVRGSGGSTPSVWSAGRADTMVGALGVSAISFTGVSSGQLYVSAAGSSATEVFHRGASSVVVSGAGASTTAVSQVSTASIRDLQLPAFPDDMATFKYKLALKQGETFRKTFTWKVGTVEQNTPVDLSGCTARMHIREDIDGAIIMPLTTENGKISLGGAAGTLTLHIPATETSAMPVSGGVYDLEIVYEDGTVKRIMSGAVTVSPEVTR